MVQRQFLRSDDWALIEASDLPSLEGLLGVLTVLQGGTGLDYIGPNNTLLASTGFEAKWRKITDLMIQPEYRTGVGPSIVTSTITSPTDGDVLTYVAASGDWINQAPSGGGTHDILSATHTDTLAAAVSRGSILVGNATPLWSEKTIGAAGAILRSDGTDLLYSTATYPTTTTINRILYSSANDVIGQIATANTRALLTDGSGVPSLAQITTAYLASVKGTGTVVPVGTFGTPNVADYIGWDGGNFKDMVISAGTGLEVAWATTGTTISPAITTGYWTLPVSGWVPGTATVPVAGANIVHGLRFYLPCRLTVNSIHFRMTSNAGANNYSVGIYDNAGTTKLMVSTVFASGIGTKSTTLGAAVTLAPGFYWAVFTADGTSATWTSVTGSTVTGAFNAGTSQWIDAGNASAVGVLPTTLGTLTTATTSTASFPFIKLQN